MATVIYNKGPWSQFGDAAAAAYGQAQDPQRREQALRLQALQKLMQQGQGYGGALGTLKRQANPMADFQDQLRRKYGEDQILANLAATRAGTANTQETTRLMDPKLQAAIERNKQMDLFNQLQLGFKQDQEVNKVNQQAAELSNTQSNQQANFAVDVAQTLSKSDDKAETALAKAYMPSNKERVYLDNASRKLASVGVLSGKLDDSQKASVATSVIGDVRKSLDVYKQSGDLDAQLAAFQKAVQMFKGYKGTENDWLWQEFLNMAMNYKPVVQEDTWGGTNSVKDLLGLGPDKTFDPYKEATQ